MRFGTLLLALSLSFYAQESLGEASDLSVEDLKTMDCPENPVRLGVLGDSLADGLWGALTRSFSRCSTVNILRLSRVSDGLTMSPPDIWMDRISDVTEPSDAQDVMIVQIGANDLTNLRDGRKRLSYGSKEWDQAYQLRVQQLSESLRDRSDTVLWVGLPIVGVSRYDPEYKKMNKLIETALSKSQVEFVDIREYSKFGTIGYARNGNVDGRIQQLRAPDQVHFTELGYEVIVHSVSDQIMAAMERRERKAVFGSAALQ